MNTAQMLPITEAVTKAAPKNLERNFNDAIQGFLKMKLHQTFF